MSTMSTSIAFCPDEHWEITGPQKLVTIQENSQKIETIHEISQFFE
jgi:hypothetical protein